MVSITNRSPIRWRSIGLLPAVVMVLAAGCGQSRSVDDWLEQLRNPDILLRRQACRELGSLPAEASRTVPPLIEALRDEDAHVRHDAAMALGKLGPEARPAVSSLIAALGDKDKRVHAAAAAALKKIEPDAAVKPGGH